MSNSGTNLVFNFVASFLFTSYDYECDAAFERDKAIIISKNKKKVSNKNILRSIT